MLIKKIDIAKFQRPQHHVKKAWQQFDTPLIRRKDIDWDKIEKEETKSKLVQHSEIKSDHLAKVVENYNKDGK